MQSKTIYELTIDEDKKIYSYQNMLLFYKEQYLFFRVCILFDYIYFFSFRWYFIQKMAKSQAKIKEIYYGSSDFS